MHWAADLIGAPYERGAQGPDAWDCWSLTRHVFAARYGIVMPVIAIDDASADNVRAIRQAAHASGWRPAHDDKPRDGDVALMRNLLGERHVGVIVEADGALGLLHAVQGPGVCFEALAAVRMGFSGLEVWRRTCAV
jgi:cell wall-associated NlpC family hydrolase